MTTLNTQPLQPLQPKKKFILIDELLPDTTQRRSITTEAHRVYTGIWNKLNRYPSDAIWIKNDQLSIMARVSPENLDKALSELSSAGLLEIKVGMVQNQYRIISADDTDTDTQT